MSQAKKDDETYDSASKRHARADHPKSDLARGRLKSAYPDDLEVTIDLGRTRTVLGRQFDDKAMPPILHPTVSRSHFAIEWDASLGVHVGRDLGSRNGSSLDGRRLGRGWEPLRPGSVLRIGDVVLIYEKGRTLDEADAPEVSRDAVPGSAFSVRRLRTMLSRAAPDVSPVLIIGETGTGKEQIASEVHRLSGRTGDFVPINCATLGAELIESQLFGHVKGAFTGATSDQVGLFRAAEGGTLFLDEIGEMPLGLQPKLLRAIQEKEVRAVGATKSQRVDVRVIAATHRDLAEKSRAGEFRQDLYARLALWELRVPPVRERRADVIAWLERLHRIWMEERNLQEAPPLRLEADAAEALILSDWPENLRGLGRFLHEIAQRSASGQPIRREDLPGWLIDRAEGRDGA